MARIRTIKPDFWLDEDLAQLPPDTRLLAIGLLNHSDDEGYFKANEKLVRAAIFPFSESSLSVQDMLSQLSKIGYIRLSKGPDGKLYGWVVNFLKHQRINRPTPSNINALGLFSESSLNTHTQLTVGKEGKGKEIEGKGKEGKQSGFIKPTLQELINEFSSRVTNPEREANTFLNHYESNGWQVGKVKMKSWPHAVTNWITRSKQNGNKSYKTNSDRLEESFRHAGFRSEGESDEGNFETINGLEIDTASNRNAR